MPEANSAPFPPNPVSRHPQIIPPEPGQKPKLLERLREALHRWINPRTGEQGRHHVDESIVQKAIRAAVRKPYKTHGYFICQEKNLIIPAITGKTELVSSADRTPAMGSYLETI